MNEEAIPAVTESLILGAGPTGIGLGAVTGWPILEARSRPGGICGSYYVTRTGDVSVEKAGCYRFEHGGGHWLFGVNSELAQMLNSKSELEYFERDSAVFFPDTQSYVPYPIQHHLDSLPPGVAKAVGQELEQTAAPSCDSATLSLQDWLFSRYGPILCRLFFSPFHDLYTCGLQGRIAPQDEQKSPTAGASAGRPGGYNVQFAYPKHGLDDLFRNLVGECRVHYGSEVIGIDPKNRIVTLASGFRVRYGRLYSTLPLNLMLDYTNLGCLPQPDPAIAVHVVNIGARKGPRCPSNHWLYLPHGRAGFHRVGFYSNVSARFLPESVRDAGSHAALYVEKCVLDADLPVDYRHGVIDELTQWQWIESVEAVSESFVSPAYTWSWIGSTWKEVALRTLEDVGIMQLGRYGRWHFQGIADSLLEGMGLGREVLSGN